MADKATKEGLLTDRLDYIVPKSGKVVDRDNGIRVSTDAQMARLKPAFVKPHGTITAANASFLVRKTTATLLHPFNTSSEYTWAGVYGKAEHPKWH